MFEKLRSVVPTGHGDEVVLECRDCGTAVDDADRCPNCDSEDIARYVID